MGRCSKMIAAGAAALAGTQLLRQEAFVPGPMRAPAAAAALAAGFAPAAYADPIGDAAKRLGDASYDFAKSVDWNNPLYLKPPGSFDAGKALNAIDKMIVMGAQADSVLLKKAAEAHHKAILSIGASKTGMTSRDDWDAVNAALGRVIASVPEATVMDVYNAVSDITDPAVPAYLKSLANGPAADRAYAGLLDFAQTVKANQVTSRAGFASVPKNDEIGAAAKALSEASYPFLKEVDWNSDLYFQPLPGVTTKQVLKAVDKTIFMGSKIGANELKAGAEAHHKAIGSIDASGVTSLEDYTAVNAAIGRMIESTPSARVMDVYNAWAGILSPAVPQKLVSGVSRADAEAAYKAFLEFKDVVKVAQAGYKGGVSTGFSFGR